MRQKPPAVTFTFKEQGCDWTFIRPADPEAILDSLSEEEYRKDQFLPYWTEYWPSAEILFRYLSRQPAPRVGYACELGSGLGVIAAVLRARGTRTIATDLAFEACLFARDNMLRYNKSGPAVCTDWRFPPFRSMFDLVVGSDILYEARWTAPVVNALDTLMTLNGQALIADPCRTHWPRFLEQAGQKGFCVSIVHTAKSNSDKTTIQIARITRGKH